MATSSSDNCKKRHNAPLIVKDRIIFLKEVVFKSGVTFNEDITISKAITNSNGDVILSTVPVEPPINFIPIDADYVPGTPLPLQSRPAINFVTILTNLAGPLQVATRNSQVIRIFNGSPSRQSTQAILSDGTLVEIAYRRSARITISSSGVVDVVNE